MKIFRLFATVLMVALCSTVVTSCSDDDDDKDSSDLSTIIVGTWKITAWESDEGTEGAVGTQFTFKKDGFMDLGTAKNVAKWSILKKGATYKDEMHGNTILQYDALLLTYLTAEDNGDEAVYLIKEHTSNTVQVSILQFELGGGYSRGTLTKTK